jgi:regulatory protein
MIKEQLSPYNKALDILSRRDHTEYEIRTKLKQKKYTATQINDTIDKLFVNKLLNDSAFTERYITTTIRHKEVGPRWLHQKLKQRGVRENIISEANANLLNENKQLKLIKQAIIKWQKLHSQHATDRTRLTRFLLSRGFQMQSINQEINNILN